MSFLWVPAEDAIRIWLLRASGFGDQFVIHKNDNANAPDTDYINFVMGAGRGIGNDALTTEYDAAGSADQQIITTVEGQREATLTVQAFTVDRNGEAAARSVLGRCQTALALPSIRELLADVGVVIFDHGSIEYVPEVVSTLFIGRAVLTCRYYYTDNMSERGTWIETVQVLDEDTNEVIEVDT